MKNLTIATLSLTLAFALAACHEPEPVETSETGELTDSDPRVPDDDSPYDEYTFEAGEDWTIEASMEAAERPDGSPAFDTYLWLIGPDHTSLVQDDDGGEGTASHFTYNTTAAGPYTLRANSFDGSGRGAYTLRYTARPGSAQQ